MSIRFRKSMKLMPGIRLNLSKGGVSVRAGVRGAGVTVGKSGTTASGGIPGTGIYASHRLTTRSQPSGPNAVILIGLMFMVIVGIVACIMLFGRA